MTLRVGLVGAGPWAWDWHAPMLAEGPGTTLAAVWTRHRPAADQLARATGSVAVPTFEELLERCEAVAFAVPPDVQARLAPRAAAAGRHLLLEKPLAFTVPDAEAVASAVDAAGVCTLLMLRHRFSPAGRRFLTEMEGRHAYGAQAAFVSGAALEGARFATPWRVARGALLDVGPHVLDLLESALGETAGISAAGDPRHWLAVTTTHEGSAIGQAALSITTPGGHRQVSLRVATDRGEVALDPPAAGDDEACRRTIATEFADLVATGRRSPVDVRRGLALQRLLARVEADPGVRGWRV